MFSIKIKSVPRPYHYQWVASLKTVCRKVGTYPPSQAMTTKIISKVDAWSSAVENLKVASIVLWIVEPAACKVLASLGVGDPVRRPGQIFISSGAAGLGGEDFAVPGPRWWALDVPRYVSGE